MVVTSLDAITKNILLKRGYSLHWYIDFLVYCKDGLREISLDENIQTLRRVVVPVNQDTFRADIPADCQDIARVYLRTDQFLRPLVEDDSLDIIPNYDSNFNVQPYAQGVASQAASQNNQFQTFNNSGYWWMCNWDVYGENLGRQFGGVGSYIDTYRVDKAANEIKFNERLAITEAVIEYIGDGMDADNATHIDVYAKETIERYAMWQFYLHNRTYSTGEANSMEQGYLQERIRLRARVSDLTLDKVKRAVQRNNIRVKY